MNYTHRAPATALSLFCPLEFCHHIHPPPLLSQKFTFKEIHAQGRAEEPTRGKSSRVRKRYLLRTFSDPVLAPCPAPPTPWVTFLLAS